MAGRYKVASLDDRTSDDGLQFHSARELGHYYQFRALARSGAIQKLERQVRYPLFAAQPIKDNGVFTGNFNPVAVSHYIADFVVTELDGTVRVYDSKGHRTAEFKRSAKWFLACYPHLRLVEI